MRDDLFVFATVNELFEEFSSINSLFIRLTHESSEYQLWHIFDFDILQIKMLSIFMLSYNHSFGVFHEFIIWSGVIFIWFLFVQQLTSQVNDMEEIIQMNLIWISLLVWVVVVIVLFVVAGFQSRSPDSFENELTFSKGNWSTNNLEFSVSLIWLFLADVACSLGHVEID